jgi:TonB family protein
LRRKFHTFVRLGSLAIFLAGGFAAQTNTAYAQTGACGLTSIHETTPLIYPPIARVAHVSGTVVLMAKFKTSGEVEDVRILGGAPMLQKAATSFVQGWRANEYTGPRECPVAITFRVEGIPKGCDDIHYKSKPPFVVRDDVQHVTIVSPALCVNVDAVGKRGHRFRL